MSTMGCTASRMFSMTVFALVELGLLLEHADGVALGHGDLADVVLVDAGHDAQQRGLARAVQAEHADLGAVVEAERDVAQDLFVGGHDAPHLVHGVDDLGIGWHGGILPCERVRIGARRQFQPELAGTVSFDFYFHAFFWKYCQPRRMRMEIKLIKAPQKFL